MRVDLREPLGELVNLPTEYTRELRFPPPSEIKIYDDTLRDGEQMPGVLFTPRQKYELTRLLSEIGVHLMDIAFPGITQSEEDAIGLIVEGRRRGEIRADLELMVMARANRGDIDNAVRVLERAGTSPREMSIIILSTTSDLHIKYKLGKTLLRCEGRSEEEWLETPLDFYREANIHLITDAISYARGRGFGTIEFASEDCSRSNLDYTVKWAKSCVAAGGSRMCFSDTLGVFTPQAVDYYFPPLVEALGKTPIAAHFHNDFGVGAINTVLALSHGAIYASMTANGIGERAGNASLHQVVMILKDLYGIRLPGFKYERLRELGRLVELYSGVPMQAHEPIVGENVFTHESGIHTAAIAIHPATYQFINPQDLGGEIKFVFGKHSGSSAVEAVLRKHEKDLGARGVEITPELISRMVEKVKELREKMNPPDGYRGVIDHYYRTLRNLGISEERLLQLVLEEHSKTQGATSIKSV